MGSGLLGARSTSTDDPPYIHMTRAPRRSSGSERWRGGVLCFSAGKSVAVPYCLSNLLI